MRGRLFRGGMLCSAFLAAVAAATAQSPYQLGKSVMSDAEFYTTNYGIFGFNVRAATPGFIVPRGSGTAYLFGAGLWFGAQKVVGEDTNRLAFITYDPNMGDGWAAPVGAPDPATAEPLYHSVQYNHVTGRPFELGTLPPWPLWLFDGRIARPGEAGMFETNWGKRVVGGDYAQPAFMPDVDEQFVANFHDRLLTRYTRLTPDSAESIGYPIGLDIVQNIYSWSSGPFENMVMIEYNILNTSGGELYNCVVSQMTDPDIGIAANDHASYFTGRPELRAAAAWTDTESRAYKVLVTAIVEGPVVDESGYIDRSPGARTRYKSDGRVGTCQVWSIEEDPLTPTNLYDFMSDHTQFDVDYGPGDRRLLMGSTPFHMRRGDIVNFTVVYAIVETRPEFPGRPPQLVTLLEEVNDAYYKGRFASAPAEPSLAGAHSMMLLPNPARDRATVRFTVEGGSEGTLEVMNTLGEEVMRRDLGRLESGTHEASIDLRELPAGLYLVRVTTGSATSTAKLTVTR